MMNIADHNNKDAIAALSRLFCSTTVRELSKKGRSRTLASAARHAKLHYLIDSDATLKDVYPIAFDLLSKSSYRSEYVYKSILAKKILFGVHSLNTATLLSEFRVGHRNIADIVIVNGTSTVYEIKSDLDNLNKLERQVAAYQKVFPRINILASERHLNEIENLVPKHVGILRLNRRRQISTIRPPFDNFDNINAINIFESIRTTEATRILSENGIHIGSVPNGDMRRIAKEYFSALSPETAHQGMVEVLRASRSSARLTSYLDRIPESLHAAVLTSSLPKAGKEKLEHSLNTSFHEAMDWCH